MRGKLQATPTEKIMYTISETRATRVRRLLARYAPRRLSPHRPHIRSNGVNLTCAASAPSQSAQTTGAHVRNNAIAPQTRTPPQCHLQSASSTPTAEAATSSAPKPCTLSCRFLPRCAVTIILTASTAAAAAAAPAAGSAYAPRASSPAWVQPDVAAAWSPSAPAHSY